MQNESSSVPGPVILGSQSSRRKAISCPIRPRKCEKCGLGYFTPPFVQQPSFFDEASIPYPNRPGVYVCRLAEGKSRFIKTRGRRNCHNGGHTRHFRNGKSLPQSVGTRPNQILSETAPLYRQSRRIHTPSNGKEDHCA